VDRAALDPKTANERYHDAAAASYDGKWAISFDRRARAYVRERAERMLLRHRYGRVLEVGAGTGFFVLNLWQEGYVEEAHATDISARMLEVCRTNAERLGCIVRTRAGDAERLPYGRGEFDLVVGHAFLHHLPAPREALMEMHRVTRPEGHILIAGEPTRWGHRLAGLGKVATRTAWRAAARLPGLGIGRVPQPSGSDDDRVLRELEHSVDLHAFDPGEVALWARSAGFRHVRIETEEFLASLFGWSVRTAEAEARPGLLGPRWARFAYRGWRSLSVVDRALSRVLPQRLFYNLLLSAEKPGPG
jgi:ubiquinone/menaquinone biosynthesis C-methylase UbiE